MVWFAPSDRRLPSVKCNKRPVPALEHAVRALRLQTAAAHAGCLEAAEAAGAASGAPSSRTKEDAARWDDSAHGCSTRGGCHQVGSFDAMRLGVRSRQQSSRPSFDGGCHRGGLCGGRLAVGRRGSVIASGYYLLESF